MNAGLIGLGCCFVEYMAIAFSVDTEEWVILTTRIDYNFVGMFVGSIFVSLLGF
jgi:hypothetical protein